jgi:hypothetical protein
MRHFTTEEKNDFVNLAVSDQQTAMQRHLENGCKRCGGETVPLWQKVRKTAAAKASYQPPLESVRTAKAAFATARRASKRKEADSFIEVLFDSFLQPALAGARSAGTGMRQMLYRADPYQLDVQIEMKPEGDRLAITGQLLNISQPDVAASQVLVTLSNGRGSLVYTMTNQFGEFGGEIENSGDLEISFPRPGEKPVVISLSDALDRLPGEKS